jgi:hypothetical protein
MATIWNRTSRAAVSILSLSLLGLFGCRAVNIASGFSLDERKGTGVAVVSLTVSGLPSSMNLFFNLRGVDNIYDNSVPAFDFFASSDWRCPLFGSATEDAPCGRLAIIELQQGEYEFYSWGAHSGGPVGFSASASPTDRFSKRFKVLAGKAVYLGNIHLAVSFDSPKFALLSVRYPYRIKVSDMRQRDLPLLYQKNPNITSESVVVNILPD